MEINIAICDDEKEYITEIIEHLEKQPWKRRNKFIYHTFYSGKELLESKQDFDVVILDIKMKDVSGVNVKNIFYERNIKYPIIFLTNYDEYMKESFGRNVYGYVNKSKISDLDIPLAKIYKELMENVTITINDKLINLRKVYYAKADGPYVNIHYKEGDDVFRMTLTEFTNRINNPNFVRSHKSYLVNMRYIKKIEPRTITLDNGETVALSYAKRTSVKRIYHQYLMENITYD
ncbi:MAG: LytR/AlgR family response regulator transcription factor [Thomasclavelia sp.]